MEYEYKFIHISCDGAFYDENMEEVEEQLNEYGKEGWELISTYVEIDETFETRLHVVPTFKRPIN